jgi:tRNA nucleotidyltransferase (CCA-adding enzyme)
VKYISGEVKKNQKIAGEIRLAKAFTRAQRCYGAEGYIRGFSGYSLEILVIHFGGFVKFLKGISRKQVIDPMKYFKNEREIMRELNSSKLQGPVVVVDPTYKFRNVCAGLGLASFEKFLEVSKKFLSKPSLEFFDKKDIDVEELRNFAKEKKALFLELGLSSDRQEGDIAGTKMKKFFGFFEKELGGHGQEVLRSEFDYSGSGNVAKGYLVVLEKRIIERKGPSVGLEEQAKKFCVANKDCFKRKGFWWCRDNVSVEGVLKFVKKVSVEMGADIKLKNN